MPDHPLATKTAYGSLSNGPQITAQGNPVGVKCLSEPARIDRPVALPGCKCIDCPGMGLQTWPTPQEQRFSVDRYSVDRRAICKNVAAHVENSACPDLCRTKKHLGCSSLSTSSRGLSWPSDLVRKAGMQMNRHTTPRPMRRAGKQRSRKQPSGAVQET